MESIEQIAINEFDKVGDDGLFPNHTDKDIWVSGFKAGFEYKSDDGWIPVIDVDRLPTDINGWYLVARGEIIGLIGHHYLNGSWFGYGCATATNGITHFRKFPEGAKK